MCPHFARNGAVGGLRQRPHCFRVPRSVTAAGRRSAAPVPPVIFVPLVFVPESEDRRPAVLVLSAADCVDSPRRTPPLSIRPRLAVGRFSRRVSALLRTLSYIDFQYRGTYARNPSTRADTVSFDAAAWKRSVVSIKMPRARSPELFTSALNCSLCCAEAAAGSPGPTGATVAPGAPLVLPCSLSLWSFNVLYRFRMPRNTAKSLPGSASRTRVRYVLLR